VEKGLRNAKNLRISDERFAKGLRMVCQIRPIFLFFRMLYESTFTKDLRIILDIIAKLTFESDLRRQYGDFANRRR
jgi:hypothetical protein